MILAISATAKNQTAIFGQNRAVTKAKLSFLESTIQADADFRLLGSSNTDLGGIFCRRWRYQPIFLEGLEFF